VQQLRFVTSTPQQLFGGAEYHQDAEGVGGRMELGAWCVGPDRRLAVGALGVFADEVLGYALMASMPPGGWSISTEIWLDVLGPLPGPDTVLTGQARSVAAGSFSTGELRDASGRTVVLCRQRGRAAPAPEDGRHLVTGGAVARCGDIDALLGLRFDGAAYRLVAGPDLTNPLGNLHGGVSLAASELVAARSRAARGCDLVTTSIHIVHTRRVPSGASLELRAETRHAGRTLWVTEVVGRARGRTSTVATITAQA